MTPRTNGRRWLGIGLVLSLAINAFFIGAAATDLIRFDKDRDSRRQGVLRYELRWLAARLPPDAMADIEAAVAAERPDARRHIESLHALRTDLGTLLAAAAPDRTAIDAKLAAIRAELDEMLGSAQATTTDALLKLPPDTRKALAGN